MHRCQFAVVLVILTALLLSAGSLSLCLTGECGTMDCCKPGSDSPASRMKGADCCRFAPLPATRTLAAVAASGAPQNLRESGKLLAVVSAAWSPVFQSGAFLTFDRFLASYPIRSHPLFLLNAALLR